ncbi:peptidase M14 [Lutibacter sp. A80]|uniref:M14 family zinc carboxypeptidase n=1 Tax=Lutibacter sp. A80 TaxID=2918453 RepID=UPI001F062BE7|nr:M14 family zinc carboxypeptidase [Lutibacter sp. A80]UMB61980.1 peptidase M14 [Lutibacter sp. A80]
MKLIFNSLAMLFFSVVFSQNIDFTSNLYNTYHSYKESSLTHRRIKYNNIQPLVNKLKKDSKYTVKKVGESIEGRDLNLISIGTGKTTVFLWSQMHGDEPTATQAIFDIFNFIDSDDFSEEKKELLSNLTLHFLPMLNPDGAEIYTRRNALGIDINRDALRLQSPEGQVLKKIRDSLDADFGFNLHDQSIYYNAERTDKTATISYLAPAYNYEKDINNVRANAMKIIVFMNSVIQKYAPGQVGRYNDDFEPRAFGDNIQKWGTSAILIESGGYKNDIEKQEIRKLNYVSILSAIYTIANGSYHNISIEDYEKIPQNDRKLFDLKIQAVTYNLLGKDYIIDIGINRAEVDNEDHSSYYNVGRVADQGDLSTFFGYETLDAENYSIEAGKTYPKVFKAIKEIEDLDIYKLLKDGYTYVKVENLPENSRFINKPIHLVNPVFEAPKLKIKVGVNATFLLKKKGEIKYAIINGFLINLDNSKTNFRNALIYK